MRYEATRASRASAAAWLRSPAGRGQSFDLGQPSDRSEGSGAATQRNQAPPGPIHLPESFGGSAEGSVAVGGGRSVRPVPNPRAGKPVPRGMGFPAHVGATADRRSRRAAHAIWQRTDGRGRSVRPVPNPRAGKPVARGMGFPAHVGATADRRARRAAHAIWQQARLNTSSEVLGAYD